MLILVPLFVNVTAWVVPSFKVNPAASQHPSDESKTHINKGKQMETSQNFLHSHALNGKEK